MAVPKYFEMYKSFLRGLADGAERPYIDIKNQVIKDLNISDADVRELLNCLVTSGNMKNISNPLIDKSSFQFGSCT